MKFKPPTGVSKRFFPKLLWKITFCMLLSAGIMLIFDGATYLSGHEDRTISNTFQRFFGGSAISMVWGLAGYVLGSVQVLVTRWGATPDVKNKNKLIASSLWWITTVLFFTAGFLVLIDSVTFLYGAEDETVTDHLQKWFGGTTVSWRSGLFGYFIGALQMHLTRWGALPIKPDTPEDTNVK